MMILQTYIFNSSVSEEYLVTTELYWSEVLKKSNLRIISKPDGKRQCAWVPDSVRP